MGENYETDFHSTLLRWDKRFTCSAMQREFCISNRIADGRIDSCTRLQSQKSRKCNLASGPRQEDVLGRGPMEASRLGSLLTMVRMPVLADRVAQQLNCCPD